MNDPIESPVRAPTPRAEPSAQVTLREAHKDDVPQVVALLSEVLAEFGLTFGEGSETDAQVLALPDSYASAGGRFWVAVDADGALLGTCGVYPLDPDRWELRKMYLVRASRGRGVGRMLLDQAVAWARDHGAKTMVLDTTEQMTSAIAFYESHGFVRDDSQVRGCRCSRGYARPLA
jgi:putative acetyltransferase